MSGHDGTGSSGAEAEPGDTGAGARGGCAGLRLGKRLAWFLIGFQRFLWSSASWPADFLAEWWPESGRNLPPGYTSIGKSLPKLVPATALEQTGSCPDFGVGEHASIAWDLHDLHRLQYFDHKDEGRVRGWRSIHVTDGDHPYMGKWWVPGLAIGYEHSFVHQVADFIEGLSTGKPAFPTFRDALETQYICDAVLKSGKTGRWEKVAKVK